MAECCLYKLNKKCIKVNVAGRISNRGESVEDLGINILLIRRLC